jgi:multiple sugar transport system substrate-binding protein
MKNQHVVTIALSLVVIATLGLAGCTPAATTVPTQPTQASAIASTATQPSAQESVKLTFWNNWDGTNGTVMSAIVNKFNQTHPGIQVDDVFQPYSDIMALYQTSIPAGTNPDIAALDLILIPQLVNSQAIAPLDDFIANDSQYNIKDFYPLLVNYDVMNGKQYAVPVSTNNMQLIWNKDLFTAAGLDPETPPKTWDEMKSMAEKCANPSKGVVGFEFYTQPTGEGITWQFQVWLWSAGGQFLNADNTAAAFNTPEGLKALTFVSDMLQNHGSQPGPWGLFGDQKACMQLDGSWLFGYRKDAPFKWGIAPVPAPEGGVSASNVGGEHLFMFNSVKNKAAAWEFIKYLTSPEVQLSWDEQTGFLPVRQSVAQNADYLNWINTTEPRMLPFVQGMATAHTRPATIKYNAVSDAFSSAIQLALLGKESPADALTAAEKAVNDALKQ